MARRISVLLVDDHPLVLIGLRDFLSAQTDLKVRGMESDPIRALEALDRLRPDVAVVDLMMPGLSGLELIRQVRQVRPETRAVVLSMYSDAGYVSEALRVGASGYVLKGAQPEELLRAIHVSIGGGHYLSPPLSEEQVAQHAQRLRQRAVEPHELLTRREREVLGMVARGKTSAAIGTALGIGVRTVESHRASILGKLDLRNQAELVRYAIQHGIASLD